MCVVGPHRERFGLQHGPYSALAGPSTDLVVCDAPEPLPRRRSHQSFHRPCRSPRSRGWRAPLRLANARFTYSLKVDLMLIESV
jgi:hypothetical protein